ncbi:MAG: GWxTD domain-containing protein [Bacteroidota bacterium]|nr:GWxTD domain-containing protein [Bacteroidota bacterium]MDP4237448.1 GWxTD domain-containing protein [Bacteroidota bacterium]
MNTLFWGIGRSFVLCHLLLLGSVLHAQTEDSSKSMIFSANRFTGSGPKHSRLDGIASLSIGTYHGFRSDGLYSTTLQPSVGFEFLAEPGGSLHLLLGGHVGFSDPVTTGVSFGLRIPTEISKKPDLNVFTDIGILFFDDAAFSGPIKYGARIAFGARTIGDVDMEYRLAGEWRGMATGDSIEGYHTHALWWIGAEVGVAFSLVRHAKPLSRKDSLRAALRYIATHEEMDDFDAASSDEMLDRFLDRFWKIRDLTPSTKLNESRIEFERRVETANRMFSRSRHLGVTTDAGRVMTIYGQPDVIESQHSSYDEGAEYMVWVYSGRLKNMSFATFLFERSNRWPDWEQIYSNVPGEISGPAPQDLSPLLARWIF